MHGAASSQVEQDIVRVAPKHSDKTRAFHGYTCTICTHSRCASRSAAKIRNPGNPPPSSRPTCLWLQRSMAVGLLYVVEYWNAVPLAVDPAIKPRAIITEVRWNAVWPASSEGAAPCRILGWFWQRVKTASQQLGYPFVRSTSRLDRAASAQSATLLTPCTANAGLAAARKAKGARLKLDAVAFGQRLHRRSGRAQAGVLSRKSRHVLKPSLAAEPPGCVTRCRAARRESRSPPPEIVPRSCGSRRS